MKLALAITAAALPLAACNFANGIDRKSVV